MPATATLQDRYRQAIGRFATGVTVITSQTDDGLAGMTASAVASLSLDPPMLLVCVNNRVPTHRALERSRRFGVNVLGEGDEALALRFARPAEDKFAGLGISLEYDVPLLECAIARFVCDVHERLPGGDHSIFIGAIRHCEHVAARRPLLYFASAFGAVQQVDDALGRSAELWAMTGI
jgi:3-hydroxy-9,10-secoandrosta-1,3,5(10)-triene-9,17-dione monooxygenase reductase component